MSECQQGFDYLPVSHVAFARVSARVASSSSVTIAQHIRQVLVLLQDRQPVCAKVYRPQRYKLYQTKVRKFSLPPKQLLL